MVSSSYQQRTKTENRQKILRLLEKKPCTFKELQDETKLSPPILIKHLKQMQNEDVIDWQPVEGQPNARQHKHVYVLTNEGKKQEKLVRASVARAFQIMMKDLPSNYPAARTLSELSELAENDPKFFNELGQWITDYMALATSKEMRKWIFGHGESGVEQLKRELTRRLTPLVEKKNSQPQDPNELIALLKILLNGTREMISKG